MCPGLPTSIDQFHSEYDTPSLPDGARHLPSPEAVGASVTAWMAGARLDLSGPTTFGVTLVGAFALGLILVTIALALVPR